MFAMWFGVAQASGALVIDGSGAARSFTCAEGQRVEVTGSMLQITLSGSCGALQVEGSSNTITADGVSAITVVGASNKVTWARNLSGSPALPVSKTGTANKVTQR